MIRTANYTTIMSEMLSECQSGNFNLKKKVVRKGTVLDMYDSMEGKLYKGEYDADFPTITLQEGKAVWMSDTPYEQEGIRKPTNLAHGQVLISGLGIGLLPVFISGKCEVTHIDIVEKNKEVIDLVFNQIRISKMEIIQNDIYNFLETTPNQYDFVFIDVWENHFASIKDMVKVREMASQCLRPGGIVRCWFQELYDRVEAKLPKEPIELTGLPAVYEPCLICGKKLRNDYAGLCLDCADMLGVSEIFLRR